MNLALMVKVPSEPTLKKYGLTSAEWLQILESQGGVCAVCKKLPPSGRMCTDHDHVKNWKKLPPEQRKLYVRGLLCWTCNFYYCGRGINIDKSRNVTAYLMAYDARKHSRSGP